MLRIPRSLLIVSLVLVLAACRDERTSPAWIESLRLAESLTGTATALGNFQSELDAVLPETSLRTAASTAAALEEVRSGVAVAALIARTDERGLDGLLAIDIDRRPLAAFVPFTFPVEGLTRAQIEQVAAGGITNWRDVGGPAMRVDFVADDPEIAGLVLGEAIAVPEVDDPAAALAGRPGRVVLATGASAGPLVKPLRIDGIRPDEAGYALELRWSVVGRAGDQRVMALGQALAGRVEQRSPGVVLDAVGDIMLGRTVGRTITEHGPRYPFAAVAPLLEGSDLRAGNLELPLTERGIRARKDYTFRAPPAVTEGLVAAGFDLLTLANNHTLDYGPEGLLDTLTALERAGIARPGAGTNAAEAHEPAILTANGLRLAVLSYVNTPNDGRTGWVAESMKAGEGSPGVAWGTAEAIRRDVAAARNRADLVIVALHAGSEYLAAPNAVQQELAYAAVDAGAALVLGAHPHVLQGIEVYKGAPIVYSLGNFVFDVDDDDRRQPGLPSVLSAVLRIRLDKGGVRGLEVRPAIIDERDGRPIPVTGAAARPVYERIYSLTDALNSGR